jgi:hypothetical protein
MTRKLALPKPDRFDRTASRIDYSRLQHAKAAPARDARFREFARRRGCAIRGLNGHRCGPHANGKLIVQFAHIAKLGTSIKSSDYRGIGLCLRAHIEQTALNWPRFAKKYDIEPDAIAKELVIEYAARVPKERAR